MAAARRWRFAAPGKGNREDPLGTLIAGRAVLVITVLAILSAATGAVALASSTGTLNEPAATADQEQGTVSGLPFQDPPDAAVTTGPDGDPTLTLDARDTDVDLADKSAHGQFSSSSQVAPTIRFNPGSNVEVHLVNHLPVATTVHVHGLRIDPASHSDDDFLCVLPADTYTFRLAVPADHPQGTYWYHSQSMGTTCPGGVSGPMTGAAMPGDVGNQVFTGLSGALIVGDDRTLLPAAYRDVTAHTLVLDDIQIDTTIRLVNGRLRPVLTMRPNETQLWRLVNAGADTFYRLRLDGYAFTVIGEDGIPVARTTTPETLLLPPGKSYDVLVTASSTPSSTWLRTTAYSSGAQGDHYPDTTLATLNVVGSAVGRLPALGAHEDDG